MDAPLSDRTKLLLVWPVAGFFVVIAFGVGLISMAAFDSSQPASARSAGDSAGETVQVELGDLFIKPATLEVDGGAVRFEVTNNGKTEHNFAIEGVAASEMIPPGGSDVLELEALEPGTYTYICEVGGHKQGGMVGELAVGGASDSAMTAPQTSMDAEEMAAHDAEVTGSFPAKTEGEGGRPLRPKVTPDGTKIFELTADEISWEVEPGKVVDGVAYNGQIPGPSIRAELGDKVRIVLNNELDQPTTVHFHGLLVPNSEDGVPAITQDAVMPGKSYVYEFRIRNSGTHMYHPHFNAQDQVVRGLLGAFLVSDPQDPEVDVDETIVINDGPLGFTLNGKGFPATKPIVVERGDTFRLRYMNEGLVMHPMHLHGLTQTVIAKDGYRLDNPYKVDTLPVAPGERYDVIVEASEPGTWALHCHILNHAESPEGMFGMVTAVVVQ